MTEQTLIERRLTLRLLAYWEKIRAGRIMPLESDIDPEDLTELWPYCFLLHAKDLTQTDYNFTYLGDAVADAYKGSFGHAQTAADLGLNAASITQGAHKVVTTAKPFVEEGEFITLSGEVVKFRQCLLPLGEGQTVSGIFGGMRFKTFA